MDNHINTSTCKEVAYIQRLNVLMALRKGDFSGYSFSKSNLTVDVMMLF